MPASRGKLLIVDDSDEIRAVLKNVLSVAGYSVDVAADGNAALERMRVERPDLVILDLIMPGLNGWGVLRRLQEDPNPPAVVTVSGEYIPPAALGLAQKYVRAHVIKPFHMATLLETCSKVLCPDVAATGYRDRERRHTERRPIFSLVTLLSADRTPLAVGRAVDLSLDGLRIHLGADLIAGQHVRLALDLPGSSDPVYLRGVSRWSSEGFVGIELEDLTDDAEQRLKAFLGAS